MQKLQSFSSHHTTYLKPTSKKNGSIITSYRRERISPYNQLKPPFRMKSKHHSQRASAMKKKKRVRLSYYLGLRVCLIEATTPWQRRWGCRGWEEEREEEWESLGKASIGKRRTWTGRICPNHFGRDVYTVNKYRPDQQSVLFIYCVVLILYLSFYQWIYLLLQIYVYIYIVLVYLFL